MNPLASTTFSAGPSDTLSSIDVYANNGQQVINSIQDKKTSGLGFSFSSLLANGGKGAIGSAGSLLKSTKTGGITLNTQSVTNRLLMSTPALASSLRNMSASAQSTITGTFRDSGVTNFNMGTDSFKIPSASIGDVSAFGDYATNVNAYSMGLSAPETGVCSMYDLDSHASMIAGGVVQGSNLGIPKSYSFLTNVGASVSNNSTLLTKVASSCIPILAKNGDLGNLASLAQGPGGQVMGAVLPNYASVLKQTYSYNNYGRNTGAPLNDYTNLVSIFTGADPKWNVIDRIGDATGETGTKTFNILKILGGSREFQQLIAIGVKSLVEGDDNKYQGLAGILGKTTVDQELRRSFPKLWQDSYNQPQIKKTNQAIDPRLLGTLGMVTQVLTAPNQNARGLGSMIPVSGPPSTNKFPVPSDQFNYDNYPDYFSTPASFDSSSLTNPTFAPAEGTGGDF